MTVVLHAVPILLEFIPYERLKNPLWNGLKEKKVSTGLELTEHRRRYLNEWKLYLYSDCSARSLLSLQDHYSSYCAFVSYASTNNGHGVKTVRYIHYFFSAKKSIIRLLLKNLHICQYVTSIKFLRLTERVRGLSAATQTVRIRCLEEMRNDSSKWRFLHRDRARLRGKPRLTPISTHHQRSCWWRRCKIIRPFSQTLNNIAKKGEIFSWWGRGVGRSLGNLTRPSFECSATSYTQDGILPTYSKA